MSKKRYRPEEIIAKKQGKPFAPGLRPAVTPCPNLSLPVHLEHGLTG